MCIKDLGPYLGTVGRFCSLRLSFFFSFLFNFLLILCEFHIMHPSPTHLLVPSFAIQPLPPQKIKHIQTIQATHRQPIITEAVVCHSVFPVCPAVHTSSLANVYCNESLVSGLRPLASVTPSILDLHWDSSWLPCCCPVSWGPSDLELQNWPLHASQPFTDDTDFGVG